jgi:hypothetical protein
VTNHANPTANDLEIFFHPNRRWVRIPILLFSIVFLAALALSNGMNPLDSGGFLVCCLAITIHVAVCWTLYRREPKRIEVQGRAMTVVWKSRSEEYAVETINTRRLSRFIHSGATIVSNGQSWFVVFDDLSEIDAFMERLQPHPPRSEASET